MTTTKKKLGNVKDIVNRFGILLVLVLLCVVGALTTDKFLTWDNLMNILRQNSFTMIVACGITMVIICGKTDLSAGAVCCIGGTIGVDFYIKTGSIAIAFVVAVVIGLICGFANGYMVAALNVPAFIATLATQIVCRGAVLMYTGGWPIYNLGGITVLGKGYWPIIFILIFFSVTWIILNRTRLGRHMYATGGNEDVAIASGIKTKRLLISTFMMCSAFAAFAGVLLMCRLSSASPTAAEGLEFEAIIGTIIGGTSFSGGIGTIGGSMIGCLIMGVINNILNLLGVQSYIHQVIKGLLIAVAVIYDINARNKKSR